jgi:tetratricopeptide (TPR) repeat protein
VLDLLAKAFEGAGQPDRALKVLNELARVAGERGDIPLETSALRRASKLGLDDPELKNRLEQAEARLARLERRLSSLALYQPADEKVLRCQARSEVLHRYGFTERAVACIQEGLAAESDSIPLLATLAEIHVDMDKKEEAIAFMFQIHARAGSEADAVADRIDILGGSAPIEAVKPTQPAVSDDEVVVDDEEEEVIEEIIDDEDAPTGEVAIPAELKGDRLADAGDLQGALLSWREALGADPSNERILQKIASLRSRARATPPPEPPKTVEKPAPPKPVEPVKPPPVDDDIFARMLAEDPVIEEIDPEELDESPQLESKPTAEPEKDERVLEARSLVAVGLNQEGLVMLQGVAGLAARVIEAQALKNLAQLSRAVDVLREASNEAAVADPAYPEALFELAGLYIVTAKYKAALRLIEELMDVAPDYRTQDVVARNRGLNRLMKG